MSLTVSLTSTKSRLPVLRHTLLSLTEQAYKPDKILVQLSHEPYLSDEGIDSEPQWLNEMTKNTLVEVNWVKNTGPYRKLLPSLALANAEDLIVTCDDDVIYGPDWLKLLIESAEKYPDTIVCGRARKPVKNIFGITQSYIHWPLLRSSREDKNILPIGVAGVVYRKRLLSEKLINSDRYLKLAPKQDDLWFNVAAKEAGSHFLVAEGVDNHVHEIKTSVNLSQTNASVQLHGWDKFFLAVSSRMIFKIRGYLGFPSCENDVAMKKITRFVARS